MMNRIFRVLICFLLICCLVVNISPIKAEATLVTAGTVTVAVAPIVVSIIKGLGVTALTAAGAAALSTVTESCIANLQTLGLCQETTIEVFGYTFNGYSVFGVTPSIIQAVRDWLFDSGTVCESSGYTFDDSGFTYNTSSSTMGNLYWSNVNLYDICQSAGSGVMPVCISNSSYYGIAIVDSSYLCSATISSLTPYTSSTYPMGSFCDGCTYSLNTSSSNWIVYLSEADAHNAWLSSQTLTYFLTSDSYIERYSSSKYHGSFWLYDIGSISAAGTVSYGVSKLFYGRYSTSSAACYLLYPPYTEGATVTVVDDLSADYIATQDQELSVGYSTWYGNSTTVQDAETDEETIVLPIPQVYTYDDAVTGTQEGIWEGTLSNTEADTGTDTGTDSGTLAQTIMDFFTPSGTVEAYTLDLSTLFPFCIPFDLYDFLVTLQAEPVTPQFDFDLSFGSLGSFPVSVDFSEWDDLAALLRTCEVALFIVGLGVKTKDLLGG